MVRLSAIALLMLPSLAQADLNRFVRKVRPAVGQQRYFANLKVARPVAKLLKTVGLGRWVHQRRVVQVTNDSLGHFTKETARGYLEVMVPANTGHLFFRHGGEVYDFYQNGFRWGPVRPIKNERYGMLLRLTPNQERRLTRYLGGLKKTCGKELGTYDFSGRKGFHCVSWIMRLALDGKGQNLVQLLGGKPDQRMGMPSFSRFLLKRAEPLEAIVLYNNTTHSSSQLSRKRPLLMSNRQIVRAYRQLKGQ
jgi:hypothetical protein